MPKDPMPDNPQSGTVDQIKRVPMVPTWSPSDEAGKKDVTLATIAAANVNGEYGVLNGSNPAYDDALPASWSSDHLHGSDDGASAVGPSTFARDGGTKR